MPAKTFTIFFILFITFFFTSSIYSKEGCNSIPSQFNGPQYYLPGDTAAANCNTPSFERQKQELQTSGVVCVDDPSLVVEIINNDVRNNLSLFPKVLGGDSKLQLVAYDGFGLENEKVQNIPDELINFIGRAISIPDQYDPTLGDALCVYNNILNNKDCNTYLNNLNPSGNSNYIGNAGFLRSSTTREIQFNQKKIRAKEIVDCYNDQESPLTACDAPYIANQTTGETSLNLAEQLLSIPDYAAFQQLTTQKQFTLLSLRESKALSAVYIVVKEKTQGNPTFELIDLIIPDQNKILTNYIPGVHQSTVGSQYVYALNSRKIDAVEGAKRINQNLNTPLSKDTIEELVFEKINNSNIICPPIVYQSTGSHAKYDEAGKPITIPLGFNVVGMWEDAINERIDQTYEAFLVTPTALISQFVGEDENAPLAKQFKKNLQTDFQKITFLPHDLSDTPPRVTTDIHTFEASETADGSTISGEIAYSANNNVQAPQPAGLVGDTSLFIKGKNAWKKSTAQYYKSTCYAYETLQKASSKFAALGLTIFDSLGTSIFSPDNCRPDPTIQENSSSSNTDICGVADEYNIPCCQLEGIMRQETGYGTADYWPGTQSCGSAPEDCCNGIGCGPAQITCGQIDDFSGNDNLNVCDPVDSAILLSRAMKLKLCQAAGECVTYKWEQEKSKLDKYQVDDGDYTAAAYFNGLNNGCYVSGCSQFRWGAGKSYCDSVASFCTTGDILPSVSDMNFCQDCNTELIRSGVPPMSCP